MSSEIFSKIADEIRSGNTDQGLWTQAFAECDGDEPKTKALYIRLRYAQLSAGADLAAGAAASSIPKLSSALPISKPQATELDKLRAQLKTKLKETGKQSFYQLLELEPDVDDTRVAATIAKLKARVAQGEILSSEVGYAVDALGTPEGREKYDRRLLGLMTQAAAPVAVPVMMIRSARSTSDHWWKSGLGKMSIFGAVLLLVFLGPLAMLRSRAPSQGVPVDTPSVIQYDAQADVARRADGQAREDAAASRLAAQQFRSATGGRSACQEEVDRYRAAVSQAAANYNEAQKRGFAQAAQNSQRGDGSALFQAMAVPAYSADERMALQAAERNYAMAKENCK